MSITDSPKDGRSAGVNVDFLAGLFDSTNLVVYLKDIEGRYIYVNRRYERLSTFPREALLGKRDSDFFPPEVADLFLAQDAQVIARRGLIEFEETIPLPGGEHSFITEKFPLFNEKGEVWAVGGFCTEITSQKDRADESLAEERERLAVTMRSISEGVAATDTKGAVTMLNTAAEAIAGMSQSDAMGRGIDEVLPAAGEGRKGAFGELVRLSLEAKSGAGPAEIGMAGAGGAARMVLASAGAVRDRKDNLIGAVVSLRDITGRKSMEEELRRAKQRIEMVVTSSTVMLYACEAFGDFDAVFISDNILPITGHTSEDFLSKGFWASHIHPEDAPRVFGDLAELFEHDHYAHEYLFMFKDGSYHWMYDELKLVRDDKGEPLEIIGTWSDITERRRAEAALRESEEWNKKILRTVLSGVVVVDAATRKIVDVNDMALKLIGQPKEQVIGAVCHKFICPAEEKNCPVLDCGKDVDLSEKILLTAGGEQKNILKTVVPVELRGRKYLIESFVDITERKKTEMDIREAYEMQGALNTMLQTSQANTALSEKMSGHLAALFALPWLAVQPKGAVFLMSSMGNALSLTAQQGLAPDLLKACANVPLGRCLCGKAAESGRVVESAGVGADHHTAYAGMAPHGHYCAPIRAEGKTLGVLNLYLKEGVALTESQRRFLGSVTGIMAENILHARTQEKFTQAQKMESVGRLAGGVAHDFNNILTAIQCSAGFIGKALGPEDPKAADVREILEASDHAVGLTRQLLAFSRRQILAPRVADLSACVGDVANMLRRLIGENITLATKLASAPCPAMLDTGQIGQVLMNLVVNARDAMPGGGAIELSTELLPPDEALFLAHPDLPRGPLVCLKVSDTGCGMTPEVKSHLFEPFYTTKEQGKGTGLGLSTVFGIVKQSGGDITVESEPGKGTRFIICFPYCKPEPDGTGAGKGGPAAGEAKGRETILLVEDEESLLRLGRRVMLSGGYTVLTAASGPEALKEIERHGKPVDLLVTDMLMPGMSGRELARELARRGLAGRTLYMSGYTDEDIVKHGILEPGIAFIYKPFTVDEFSSKLREVLDGPAERAKA